MASRSGIPGDVVAPAGPFWESLDPAISSTVVSSLTPEDLEALKPDPTASNPVKFHVLHTALSQKLRSLEASVQPSTLAEKNYNVWQDLKSAQFHVYKGLGDVEAQEKILLEMINTPSPAGRDLAALHNLSALYEEKGDYEKSEKLAREVLPAIQGHERLGKASPQALGSLRVLIKALRGQGKNAEAEEFAKEAKSSVDDLSGTPFAKFQQEEREALDKVLAGLQ